MPEQVIHHSAWVESIHWLLGLLCSDEPGVIFKSRIMCFSDCTWLPSLSPQNQPASTLGSTLLRCDKLDQAEIKSLLMCFLHVLKSMSEGKIAAHPKTQSLHSCLQSKQQVLECHFMFSSRCPVHILEQGFICWTHGLLHFDWVRLLLYQWKCRGVVLKKKDRWWMKMYDAIFFLLL